MKRTLLTAEELSKIVYGFVTNKSYLIDLRRMRESFYNAKPEGGVQKSLCDCGVFLNLVMDGKLSEAEEVFRSIEDPIARMGCELVWPAITWKRFINIIDYMKKNKIDLGNSVVLTAGRPSVLNGVNDFTRIGPLLEPYRELFIEDLCVLYNKGLGPFIYNLCLAEWYYQQNRLIDAETLVSRTIKEFDRDTERRLLFSALFLQARIIHANGRNVDSRSFVKNIRELCRREGELEFSFNIDAADTLMAFYDGDTDAAVRWLDESAPDEFSDFNMLDLYRYMVKIRCYIVSGKYTAVVALAEKLRPLLHEGKRHMDLCELDLLLSVSFWRSGERTLAFEALERSLKLARRRKYYRLVADEGTAIFPVLIEYIKTCGETPFLMKLVEITRSMAVRYPLYMRECVGKNENFSQMEINVLKLLEQGKTKEEIGEYFFISANTVKYHLKNIYSKLGASSATQAVWEARVRGLI